MEITEIKDRKEFAKFLNIKYEDLNFILYGTKNGASDHYNIFEIPKKNGGTRIISAPDGMLKNIQKRLSKAILLYKNEVKKINNIKTNISHGFEINKNIFTNAHIHKNKKYVLNMDIENFFPSIHFGRVKGYFEKNRFFKLDKKISMIIAQLSCHDGSLPQGAPTSPIIANLICEILDYRMLKLAKKYKLDYTRYADDLTYSTNDKTFLNDYSSFIDDVKKEIEDAGFRINDNKTRLLYKNSHQEVTGLVVNDKVNINSSYYRKTRSMAHKIYCGEEAFDDNDKIGLKQLEGRFSFINQIDFQNNILDFQKNDGIKHDFFNLNGREKEYQKFLFYKYFYNNSKPMIVTEGKTDILYLKAALKSLYVDYPKLIEKNDDGTFSYNINFLNKTRRLEYFLNIVKDGASMFKNINEFYKASKKRNPSYPNYVNYFNRINKQAPVNPVILLFDNEQEDKSKPLRNFKNSINLDDKIVDSHHLSNNLYLLTTPLKGDELESDIECLFDNDTLHMKIKGKKFNKNDDKKSFDPTNEYGKHIFSKEVYKNYKYIDFNSFRELFDNLENILKKYSDAKKDEEINMELRENFNL